MDDRIRCVDWLSAGLKSELVFADLLHAVTAAAGATNGLVEGHAEALVAVDVAEVGGAVAGSGSKVVFRASPFVARPADILEAIAPGGHSEFIALSGP